VLSKQPVTRLLMRLRIALLAIGSPPVVSTHYGILQHHEIDGRDSVELLRLLFFLPRDMSRVRGATRQA
jgi:hypothetical protein